MKFIFFAAIVLLLVVNANAQTKNLDYFTTQALQNSPLLNDYNNQVLISRLDSLKLVASYGLIVSGEGNGLYAPSFNGWGYDKALSNGQSVFAGIRVAKEFIRPDALNARLQGFKLEMARVRAQAEISKRTLQRQITEQYISAYAAQLQYESDGELIRLLEQEDIILKKLTQASVFKQTDYLTFKVTMQTNLLSRQQKKAAWHNHYIILNYLAGIADTSFTQLPPPALPGKEIKSFEETPYALSYLADSAKLANDAALIPYEYRPHITGFTDAGYQSTFEQQPYKNLGVSVGVNISIPLYDGHRKQLLYNQNALQLQTRQHYLVQARRQYDLQQFQLQDQLKQYQDMVKTAGEQLVFARTLIEANAKQLPSGDVKVIDFILAINNFMALQNGIIDNQTMIYNLQNQMQYFILP